MTLTKNFLYQGPDAPGETVCPPALNENITIRRLNATADVADLLCAGVLCYLTAGTNASDMTPTTAAFGDDSQDGIPCVVEIQQWNPYFAATTTKGVYPNKITNASATITDYTPAANTSIVVIPLEIGMKFWVLGTTNGTFDTTFGYEYVGAANGLIAAPGDPDGVAIDIVGHLFRSLATTENQNWALVQYMGKVAYDKTA